MNLNFEIKIFYLFDIFINVYTNGIIVFIRLSSPVSLSLTTPLPISIAFAFNCFLTTLDFWIPVKLPYLGFIISLTICIANCQRSCIKSLPNRFVYSTRTGEAISQAESTPPQILLKKLLILVHITNSFCVNVLMPCNF